jgi:predicted  nucleic acid-binding Zn-ribbon protein
MGPVLNGLLKLQSVENQLRAAKAKLTRCRRSVVIQENQIRTLQSALKAKKEEIQLTKVQSDRLELELKSRDGEISKLRAALNTAKTNKEYSVLLTQINTTRADNSKLEAQVLELMKDIETDEIECTKIKEQIEQQKQILEQKRKDAESLGAKYEAEISQIQEKWDEQARTIPAEQLEIFRRVAETYDGQALAVAQEQQGRNAGYTCGGCFMGITIESVNMLMSKDDIIRCQNCTRILVLSDQQEE